jgi:ribosomal protein S18 acetylase RimI-like enzyme
MIIRDATPADCHALAKLQVDSYRSTYAGLIDRKTLSRFTYEEQENDWREVLAAPNGRVLLVAEVDDATEPIAYALGRHGRLPNRRFDGELISLHVSAGWQGRGVGRQLVIAMAERLLAAGAQSMMLWVLEGNRASGFYERLGGVRLPDRGVFAGAAEIAFGWPDLEALARATAIEKDTAPQRRSAAE